MRWFAAPVVGTPISSTVKAPVGVAPGTAWHRHKQNLVIIRSLHILPVHNMDNDRDQFDYVIAGGGLAGGLLGLALASLRPSARVALIEQDARLGGNHTWSFHDADLPDEVRPWVTPLVAHRWEGHRVRFPDGERDFDTGYAAITSPLFDRVVRTRLPAAGFQVLCGDGVSMLAPNLVRTAAGRELRARVVFDARGQAGDTDGGSTVGAGHAGGARRGYQKFLGLEVELSRDAPLARPLLIDATVEQIDGFRFVYVLPFAPRRWLVEDTVYSDSPALDRTALRERIFGYVHARGQRVARVVREEAGVLPLPFDRPAAPPAGSPLSVGYRGGWYHPLTGYSFPIAVRLALAIARADSPDQVAAAMNKAWTAQERQARYCRWLTRMMFSAVAPAERWRLLARFYRLPAPTIQRFYALRLTLGDRVRLIAGRPPRWLSLTKTWRRPWSRRSSPAHTQREAS